VVQRKIVLRVIGIASATLWLVAVGIGLWMLWSYENSSAASGAPPRQWPTSSRIGLAPSGLTLVVVAHPHCPCTRATVGELALLMAQCRGRLAAYVFFFKPAEFPEGWERTDLWESAARIPGVTVLSDEGGAEALRFSAPSSGAAMLYDTQGHLLFSGGITSSRGHSGDNDGRSAIVGLVQGGETWRAETPVFGCSLISDNPTCSTGEELCNTQKP
jgi:hypothetical protein